MKNRIPFTLLFKICLKTNQYSPLKWGLGSTNMLPTPEQLAVELEIMANFQQDDYGILHNAVSKKISIMLILLIFAA